MGILLGENLWMEVIYNKILDGKELKKLQDEFCAATGLYVYCVDSVGQKVTQMSGPEQDVKKLSGIVSGEQFQALVRRLTESSLEDQAIEDTEIEAVKYAAVCVKDGGKPVITWLVCAVLEDYGADTADVAPFAYHIKERKLGQALDLLREASLHIIGGKVSAEAARAESRRSQFSKEEMEAVLERTAATTEIVQLLDCDDPIEQILLRVLRIVGNHLQIDGAYLCEIETKGAKNVNVIAEWNGEGNVSEFEQTKNQPRPSYLMQDKPLVLSTDSDVRKYKADMEKAGISALVALPITLKDKLSMYACFEVKRTARNWEIDEIKFLNDSVKLLQSILTKRIQQNSLAGSYAALEEVLDNVGSSIYVRDRESGKILFVNRSLRNCFRQELDRNLLETIFESKIPENSDNGSVELCLEETGYWYDLFYKKITWVDGRKVLMCSIYDVTEKKMYQQKIERQAFFILRSPFAPSFPMPVRIIPIACGPATSATELKRTSTDGQCPLTLSPFFKTT